MTSEVDEPVEPGGHAGPIPGSDRLFWRASLGQATFELLAAGGAVTIATLIGHLEHTERLDHLVLTKVSARAAIGVLQSLARQQAHGTDDPAP